MRIAIAGYPRAGKTTLSTKLGVEPVRHTDSCIHLGWSGVSAEVARWLHLDGPWVIEGVAVPRAIRKWLKYSDPQAQPCDVLIYLTETFEELVGGQRQMAKGCDTVFAAIAPELAARDVRIIYGPIPHMIDNGFTLEGLLDV